MKKKNKKLEKKLKAVVEFEGDEQESQNTELDLNENESHLKINTPLPKFTFEVPVQNSFEILTNPENKTAEDPDDSETFENLMEKEEQAIRDNIVKIVKKHVALKLGDIEVSSDSIKELEDKLIDEMEEKVQEKLSVYRNTLEIEAEDCADAYEKQLYFGSDMIYYDEENV